jgi:hypothetical protein
MALSLRQLLPAKLFDRSGGGRRLMIGLANRSLGQFMVNFVSNRYRLLFEIEVAPGGVEFTKKADQILQRSAEPVDRPCGNDVNLATHDFFQKPIELRPLITAFGAADAFVREFVGDDPSLPTTNRLSER